MFEQLPGPSPRAGRVFGVFFGFIGGLVAGIIIPVAVFSAAAALMPRRASGMFALVEIVNLAILGLCGRLAYKNVDHSALAVGLLIGISIAFLLNAICGLTMVAVR